MFRFGVLFLCAVLAYQASGLETEELQQRCLLLSGIRNTLANLVSGSGNGGIVGGQMPPQYVYPYQNEYIYYYYPEYEYIFVDYPYMPEYANGYYGDGTNGYYQVIEMDDASFYNDPYFTGQGPYFIYREQHQNKDHFFTNRKLNNNQFQKIKISQRAFEDLSNRNENVRRRILASREQTVPQQQQQPQQQQPERRPTSNAQIVPVQNTPNAPFVARPAIQPVQQPMGLNPSRVQVVARPQIVPRGAVMMRA